MKATRERRRSRLLARPPGQQHSLTHCIGGKAGEGRQDRGGEGRGGEGRGGGLVSSSGSEITEEERREE